MYLPCLFLCLTWFYKNNCQEIASATPFASILMMRLTLSLILLVFMGTSFAQLSPNFYTSSCPNLFTIVNSVVQSALYEERRMGASLLRLFFHDCFVNGCDGSILLDDTSSSKGEKSAAPNLNSARGFNVIDAIKSKVEQQCAGVVSCADILAIAARDSVALLGGPSWNVKLGRRDSKTASFIAANNGIPPPSSSVSSLISRFQAHGLSAKDLVALSGAHTIGLARCITFRKHIYNETSTMDDWFNRLRQGICPRYIGNGDNNTSPLDVQTPTAFDNKYYKNLIVKQGLLHSDQQLFSDDGSTTDSIVRAYSTNPGLFSSDFATAMIKMGDISPLTGSQGEIRKNCRKAN